MLGEGVVQRKFNNRRDRRCFHVARAHEINVGFAKFLLPFPNGSNLPTEKENHSPSQ